MKYVISFLLGLSILSTNFEMNAQDSSSYNTIFPEGITLKYGIGNYSVTDEYISKEKYSGTLPYYSFGWVRATNKYVYQLEMTYRNSNSINNNNVSTNITQFTLNQGFLYPFKKMTLFKNDLYIWLGPSTEFFIYINDQNIAVSGFDYAQSFAALFSLGISSELIYPVWSNFNVESSFAFSVLSLGLRIVDSEESDASPAKLLTLFSGTNVVFILGVRYYLFNNLSVKASYLLNVTRISSWEPLLSASDNLVFTLTYGF